MATVLSILSDALYEIGAYAVGGTISAAHQALGLLRFQHQLEAWQADDLTLFLEERDVFPLPAGSNTFTMGPTGNLITTRPVYIGSMNYIVPGTVPPVEVPMGPMDRQAYEALAIKTLSSSLPQLYFYSQSVPNGTVFVWPTVNQIVQLAIYSPRGVDVPATLTTNVTGPQGYAEAFLYQLALRLCGPMARPIPEALPQMAEAAFARMVRPNVQPTQLGVDAALVPSFGGAFNVLTGTTGGPSSPR
jgi:hypothetical protein